MHQQEHNQISQHPGWCEHDPKQIMDSVIACINTVLIKNTDKNLLSIGITNQRETIIAVNKITKKNISNAIVWHDSRTENIVQRLKKDKFNNNEFY
mmetsp:Transcript_40577/g.34262  ORF Transcript_40577/g.34262 Transcript_40577/m.34262 type:complete len:96 (+) Transcript_40577:74-361(+)